MNRTIKLVDENGNAITAQQAYDAAMSGPVYVLVESAPISNTITINAMGALSLRNVFKESENVVSVTFIEAGSSRDIVFYAGQNPDNIGGGTKL